MLDFRERCPKCGYILLDSGHVCATPSPVAIGHWTTLDLSLPWQVIHGDCLDVMRELPDGCVDAVVTDPPYGIAYRTNAPSSETLARSILGDEDTSVRDGFLDWWGERPALVFGSWRRPYPTRTHTKLIWDTKGALGMGDLSIPWKPSHQEIYVIGRGFIGTRGTDVLRFAPVQSMAQNGRVHPHQKPVDLLVALLEKCPRDWTILDPFCGSGSTGVACIRTGHRFLGIERERSYVDIARRRIADAAAQGNLFQEAP